MDDLWKDTNIFYNILCFLIAENEKLFDRSDSNLYWRTVYHFFGLLHHAYIGIFANTLELESSEIPEIKMLHTFRAGYLTGWNFVFQTVFLGASLAHDILEWLDKEGTNLGHKIKYWRDVIFCGVVVPCTMFVTTMFWCVYAVDRELVFPRVYDQVVPWWFNHCVHTNIAVVVAVETLLQARRKPTNVKVELTMYLIVAAAYGIVYYSIYFVTHRWLYQVFGTMNWWQVCLYQLGIWGIMYIFYRLQFPVNRLIHKEEKTEVSTEDQKTENQEDDTNGAKLNGDCTTYVPDNSKVITDLKTPPFSTKSWSIKFRSLRSQFENSRL